MKRSPYDSSHITRKLAGTVETASFLNNFFPSELTATIQPTFSSILSTPVLLKLLPATAGIETSFLHTNEITQLSKYRLPKRRSEYLTGRICAKIAAIDYLKSSLNPAPLMEKIEIVNNEQGHPSLILHTQPEITIPNISISHSGEYAAAIATQHRCGIDIQKHEQSLIKVREKYCANREFKIIAEENEADELGQLALLWSAKEAIQKSYGIKTGMPTFSEIRLQESEKRDGNNMLLFFNLPPKYCHGNSEIIPVTTTTFINYAIAVHVRGSK